MPRVFPIENTLGMTKFSVEGLSHHVSRTGYESMSAHRLATSLSDSSIALMDLM
jgi:hypothetical protein